jgi:hypothetical protein
MPLSREDKYSIQSFFFYKSVEYIKAHRSATLSTQGVYKKGLGGRGEEREKIRKTSHPRANQPTVQVNRVKRKKSRSSSLDLEKSSKHLAFRSLQTHHIIQRETIFHTTALLERPLDHQLANNSLTEQDITQQRPNRAKNAFHKALTTPQWRRR